MGIWNRAFILTDTHLQLSGSRFQDPYSIALLVFSLLPVVALPWISLARKSVYYNGSDSDLRRAAFSRLGTSNFLVVVYLLLKSLDILLSEFRVEIKYGYFFTYAFSDPFFQVFGDLLILFVVCRMYRYVFRVQGKKNRLSGIVQLGVEGLEIPLLGLFLFQWSVAIARWTVYLNNTSPTTVIALYVEYEKLLAAFNMLYLIMSAILCGNSVVSASSRWSAGLPLEEVHFLAITTILFARSMLIGITQMLYNLHRHTRPVYEPTLARALYGLLSIVLYYEITKQSEVSSSSSIEFDVLRDSLQNARKDLSRRKYDAVHGGPPYPATSAELLGELRADPLKYFSEDSVSSMTSWQDATVDSLMVKHTKKVLRMR